MNFRPVTSRRDVFKTGAALAATLVLPARAFAGPAAFAPKPGDWRVFSVTTRIELGARSAGERVEAWIPLPAFHDDDWMRPLGDEWNAEGATATFERDPQFGVRMLRLAFAPGAAAPAAEVRSKVATRDRATDFSRARDAVTLSADERRLFTAPTERIPTDGLVKATSDRIAAGLAGDVDKARAIYQWVIDNTYRDAAVRGCGTGDVGALLASGDLGGKCADINALFVGLLRAAGVPARDLYGLRVAPSAFGYRSLGASGPVVTKAQHCRAEVWLDDFGWVAADPADVRKVALEEPPGDNPMDSPKVVAARQTLFGASEGNWIAYNDGHDVALPGSRAPKLVFLMYPQAEIDGVRLDCLDPDDFRYTIRAQEIAA